MSTAAPLPQQKPWLSIIGIGEDGLAGLSAAARSHIAGAALVVGGKRHLALAAELIRGDTLAWPSPIETAFPSILARRGEPCCVLASGDPFHYGIGATLAPWLVAGEFVCLPQPSAFSLAAARLGWPLQDCACVSLHGRALDRIIPFLHSGARLLVLSWDRTTPSALAALLVARGYGPTRMTVLEAMGGAAERRHGGRADGAPLPVEADLNTIALRVEAGQGARTRPCTGGMPDASFEHDGQITKAPIRAMTLAALSPRPGDLLWDIGAGSGSVCVEWCLAHPTLQAVAIEERDERATRIGRNAARWGVDERLRVLQGRSPEALDGLPPPEAIFIGGGLTAPGLLEHCQGALRPGGRLVANSVTLESQALLIAARKAHGGDLLMTTMVQAEPVGAYLGWRPAMPNTQWTWVKP